MVVVLRRRRSRGQQYPYEWLAAVFAPDLNLIHAKTPSSSVLLSDYVDTCTATFSLGLIVNDEPSHDFEGLSVLADSCRSVPDKRFLFRVIVIMH